MSEESVPLDSIDLVSLAEALDDHGGMQWLFDPATGSTEPYLDPEWADPDLADDLETTDRVRIEPGSSRATYLVMVDFAEAVADRRSGDLLRRSLEGRGAFRRFRDTMHDFPELSQRWRTFERLSAERRALDWLMDHGYVDDGEASTAIDERAEQANEVLAEVAARSGLQIERDAVPSRWPDVVAEVGRGRPVTVTDGARVWATVEPVDRS